MEIYLLEDHSWIDLFVLGGGLLVVYVLLGASLRLLKRASLLGRWQPLIERILHTTMVIYEPLAALILAAQFILIDPWLHGLVLGVILFGAFPQLRNYLIGRFVQFDHGVRVGRRLATNAYEGNILSTDRLGVRLQSTEGVHYLDYTHLLSEGYTLLKSEQLGGFYQLEINLPTDTKASARSWQQLQDRLANVPYINWWHRPEWAPHQHNPKQFHARIAVHDEQHLHDFIALLQEWGYPANIIKH